MCEKIFETVANLSMDRLVAVMTPLPRMGDGRLAFALMPGTMFEVYRGKERGFLVACGTDDFVWCSSAGIVVGVSRGTGVPDDVQ